MKTKSLSRLIGWIAIALIVVGATVWALWPQPMDVEIGEVTRGDLTATVRGEARARVKERYIVSAPVDGELARIDLQVGDSVSKGDVVATISPLRPRLLDDRSFSEAIAAISSAQAAVERADAAEREVEVAVKHARSKLETARDLAETSSGAKKDVEHAQHELEMQEGALEVARASEHQARAELGRALAVIGADSKTNAQAEVAVRSPADGQVLRLVRESAGPVATGAALVEIGDIGELEIVADLLSRDAVAVKPGANATITRWGPGEPIPARVRRVERAGFTKVSALGIEEQRASVILDFVGPLPEGLGHDYRVDVAIETWTGTDVLRMPSTALFRSGEAWAVFVVRDGRTRLVTLKRGPSNDEWTVVEEGLDEGDQVVIQPTDQLKEHMSVE